MNDLISRQKVLTYLADLQLSVAQDDTRPTPLAYTAIEWAIKGVENLASAEPERLRGKWLRITQGAMPEQYICPFCHRTIESYGIEELLSIHYPYCHCGADMRGEE